MHNWLKVQKPLTPRSRTLLALFSFVIPVGVWCLVSYVPAVWHSQIMITDAGSVDYLKPGMRMNRGAFENEVSDAKSEKRAPPEGLPSNPIYLPAPHEVAIALYTAFITPPVSKDTPWLHQSLWQSIQIIFWGFVISSIIGVPVGLFCGTY